MRGTPLALYSDAHGRLPIGCLTTASLSPKKDSTQLHLMPRPVAAAFSATLSDAVLAFRDQPFAA